MEEVIISLRLHLLIFSNQHTHRQQVTCVQAVSPELLMCSPDGKGQQLLSPCYIFWVPLARQWQVGVCAGLLSLSLGAKKSFKSEHCLLHPPWILDEVSTCHLWLLLLGIFVAFWFRREEHVWCDLQLMWKTCSLNKFSWKSLQKHLSRMKTKQHKLMWDLPSFRKLIITSLGLRDFKEKLTRYTAKFLTPKRDRYVRDFMPCFTVSQKISLRNRQWTDYVKYKILKSLSQQETVFIYGLSCLL